MSDPSLLVATEQARLIRDGALSSPELAEAVIARIERQEPSLHAFCAFDPDKVRAAALAAQDALARGEPVGPLHGVPVSIKDLICTRDDPTQCGSAAYAGFQPEEDDICVARVRAAGGIVLGKTNTPELGYAGMGQTTLFPETANPWDLTKTPGGSSAGAAAAVASGMGSLAIGSDGAGSVRGPASFCALFGMKPSYGRIPLYPGCRDPRYPGISSWESWEHLGPMTRTVADAALLLSVIAGPDARDWHSLPAGDVDWQAAVREPLRPLRIAFTPDFGFAHVDETVRSIASEAAQVFATELGCEVVEAAPELDPDLWDVFVAMIMRDSDLTGMRALAEAGKIELPYLVAMLQHDWRGSDFTDAWIRRQRACRSIAAFMQDYDLLLTPTVSTPAFALGQFGPETIGGVPGDRAIPSPFTYPINWTGQPAASVPAGWTQEGLPVGLQIVGRHLDDAGVLRAAAAFELARPWAHRWPEFVSASG